MGIGIDKIPTDQFMLTGMKVLIKLRPIYSLTYVNYDRLIHVDRNIGIDKITTEQFMLTVM